MNLKIEFTVEMARPHVEEAAAKLAFASALTFAGWMFMIHTIRSRNSMHTISRCLPSSATVVIMWIVDGFSGDVSLRC